MGGGVSGVGSTDTYSRGDGMARLAVISGVTSTGAGTAAMPTPAQPVMAKQLTGECAGAES